MDNSSRELHRMAAAVDERHRQAMQPSTDESGPPATPVSNSRRRFLLGAGAGAGGALLGLASAAGPASWLPSAAAQNDSSDATDSSSAPGAGSSPAPTVTTTTAPPAGGDEAFVVAATSIELAVHQAYQLAASKIGDPTKKAIVTLFGRHHLDDAEAWRTIATNDKVKNPAPGDITANAQLLASLTGKINGAADDDAVLRVLYDLENQLVNTYAHGITTLTDETAFSQAGTILPIDSEHATVLGLTLGLGLDQLFPAAFESTAVGNGDDPTKGFDPNLFPPSVKPKVVASDSSDASS